MLAPISKSDPQKYMYNQRQFLAVRDWFGAIFSVLSDLIWQCRRYSHLRLKATCLLPEDPDFGAHGSPKR